MHVYVHVEVRGIFWVIPTFKTESFHLPFHNCSMEAGQKSHIPHHPLDGITYVHIMPGF